MIIISSIAGYNPEQGLTMYGVTKTALFGLTKVLYVYLFFFSFFTLFAVTDFCSSVAIFHFIIFQWPWASVESCTIFFRVPNIFLLKRWYFPTPKIFLEGINKAISKSF